MMTPDFKSILVPIDFSEQSARALDYAQTLAARFGGSLHVVHVCEVPSVATGSMDSYAIAYTNWSQQMGEEAERQLSKAVANLTAVPVSTEVLFGNPARAIVAVAASRKSDLIVMGTHGHGAVMHALMGNVAERVVRTASCPVLTVREPREAQASKPWPSKASVLTAVALVGVLLAPIGALPAAAQNPAAPPATEMRQRITGLRADLVSLATGANHGHTAGGDAATVKERIDSLVEFLRGIQVKPGH